MENDEISIFIIDREGIQHELKAPLGMNLNIMEVCKMYELPIEGRCGGMALCATCQVYLESDHQLDEQSDMELDMLDEALFVENNSRLGCQIQITKKIEGIVLRLAPEGN
ncbi:MAG: 2Fe-2S iron-sulfur cluster-binding protein [Brumimicrobium sp.]